MKKDIVSYGARAVDFLSLKPKRQTRCYSEKIGKNQTITMVGHARPQSRFLPTKSSIIIFEINMQTTETSSKICSNVLKNKHLRCENIKINANFVYEKIFICLGQVYFWYSFEISSYGNETSLPSSSTIAANLSASSFVRSATSPLFGPVKITTGLPFDGITVSRSS